MIGNIEAQTKFLDNMLEEMGVSYKPQKISSTADFERSINTPHKTYEEATQPKQSENSTGSGIYGAIFKKLGISFSTPEGVEHFKKQLAKMTVAELDKFIVNATEKEITAMSNGEGVIMGAKPADKTTYPPEVDAK